MLAPIEQGKNKSQGSEFLHYALWELHGGQ